MELLKNPSIELFGLRVDEPVTTGTDLIVGLIGIIGFLKITSAGNQKHVKLYSWFFLATGVCTIIAGLTGHAFLYRFASVTEGKMIGWVIGIIGTCFAPIAAVYHSKKWMSPALFTILFFLCLIEILIAEIILFIHPGFLIVVLHTTFGLLLILTTLEIINYSKTRSKLSRNLLYGVGFCIIAVIFNITKFSISEWCNYLDLSHLFMGISMYVMVKGVLIEQKNNLAEL